MFSIYKSEYGSDLIKRFKRKSMIEEIIEDNSINEEVKSKFESVNELSKRFNKTKKRRKRRKKRQKIEKMVELVFIGLNLVDQVTKSKSSFKLP